MIVLDLKANDEQQEILKNYLQENVSEDLAKKINKGVQITKDGKPFISKKDLDGFFDYACKKAQEQAGKGKRSACVKDDVVFGWAMHYFEEDSIEGKLYNPDGTPYEPPKPKYTPKPVSTVTPPPKKDIQPNMFDLLNKSDTVKDNETVEDCDDEEEYTEEEKQEVFAELEKEETEKPKQVSPIYTQYTELQEKYPDCVIAYRLGDFYEVFGENAVKIANILDLTLTGRDVGLPERIPMVGFPVHIADNYIGKLIEKGFKVAVVESLNNITVRRDNNIRIDIETGEILKPTNNELLNILTDLFGNTMEIRL
ncbi:MAG: hypothetical protein IJQ66_04265 [Clostridia bacterium]|nr:hypothetical protein [Clostridia bacterium]